jgi:hypothetical protein
MLKGGINLAQHSLRAPPRTNCCIGIKQETKLFLSLLQVRGLRPEVKPLDLGRVFIASGFIHELQVNDLFINRGTDVYSHLSPGRSCFPHLRPMS